MSDTDVTVPRTTSGSRSPLVAAQAVPMLQRRRWQPCYRASFELARLSHVRGRLIRARTVRACPPVACCCLLWLAACCPVAPCGATVDCFGFFILNSECRRLAAPPGGCCPPPLGSIFGCRLSICCAVCLWPSGSTDHGSRGLEEGRSLPSGFSPKKKLLGLGYGQGCPL